MQKFETESTPEYEAFVEKFKPKLTTDDCETPEIVYQAVRDWVFEHYALPPDTPVVRPFWPGGDYKNEEYPAGCVVIDNPPFSIMAEIVPWFCKQGVRFFLFMKCTAMGIQAYSIANRCTALAANCSVVYANGANVNTGFMTNLEREYIIRSAPDLYKAVEAANRENLKKIRRKKPQYVYPPNVVTSAMVGRYSRHGIDYAVPYGEGEIIRALDAQRPVKKGIFGSGLLVSERAAAERAAAERAAATVWELSPREQEIVRRLSGRENENREKAGDRFFE